VHPNPAVKEAARASFRGAPRVHLLAPHSYPDFLALLRRSWLIVSDSGGVQEEAPTLGRPLLILRDVTERPEAVEAGVARVVGSTGAALGAALEEALEPGGWAARVAAIGNPFGDGRAAERIARAIVRFLQGVPRAPVVTP
jgi:UDP-N-acetylglucosamine 2-epimerase (non-hydrolysing)